MSCEICGRGACTRSFHSLEEQEEFDSGPVQCDHGQLRRQCELCDMLQTCAEFRQRAERAEAERDAAFAMSRCECGTDECCANLVSAHQATEAARSTIAEQTKALRLAVLALAHANVTLAPGLYAEAYEAVSTALKGDS